MISLDFELHWGVRDHKDPHGPYRANLLGAREAVLRTLSLFGEFGVAATWATVGFLFARSREELERFSPTIRPAYKNSALSPYAEPLGDGEADDPLHYAPSLVEAIRRADGQELASHTFSHYYCLEAGQTREAFQADIRSAVSIAEQQGVRLRSIVFPRNQYNPAYAEVLREAGITCYRGNQPARIYRPTDALGDRPWIRATRLADTYVDLSGTSAVPWDRVVEPGGMCNVPASRFLRPYSPRLRALEPMRLRRIVGALEQASKAQEIFHLWWHPHNFGTYMEENLGVLRKILESFEKCQREQGMRSLTMDAVATHARQLGAAV